MHISERNGFRGLGPKRASTFGGRLRAAAVVSLACVPALAHAWIYSEHREIAMRAVQELDDGRRAVFEELWQEARMGGRSRLCARGADASLGLEPACIDWPALSGIAGDHSCSSRELLRSVLTSDWVLRVAAIGAQLKADLAQIPIAAGGNESPPGSVDKDRAERRADREHEAARSNAVRTADVRLQVADPEMVTRASANFAHFLLARPDTSLDPYAYAALTLRTGSPLNAIGVYAWFHLSALQKASRLGRERLTAEQRRALARAALFDEAFAMHFLEDAYSAGHVAGTWGDLSQRKGTHDYYNVHGLEVFTWGDHDRTFVLMGDAYMRPQDAELAARAVRTSLTQVLDAAAGRTRDHALPYAPSAPARADDFNACTNITFPERPEGLRFGPRYKAAMEEVLLQTPVPGLGPGPGELPRFRSELGTFLGISAGIDGRALDGGFVPSETQRGYAGGLDLSFRGGIGLEGALGDAGDGLVFGSIGLRSTSSSSNSFSDRGAGTLNGTLSSAIPGRSALSLRIRMPFYVVPGDLVFASPLYLINRDKYTKMAIRAADGGLIPWQVVRATRFGSWQFVLGREIGLTFYGRQRVDQLIVPSDTPGELGRVVNYESLAIDLPILEFRPFRTFSANQSSSVMFQFFVGADVPRHVSVAYPAGASVPDLDTVWSVGLRMVFDWRHYR